MVCVATIQDVHLFRKKHFDKFFKNFKINEESNVKKLIIIGDFTDFLRGKFSKLKSLTEKAIDEISNNYNTVYIFGNHDTVVRFLNFSKCNVYNIYKYHNMIFTHGHIIENMYKGYNNEKITELFDKWGFCNKITDNIKYLKKFVTNFGVIYGNFNYKKVKHDIIHNCSKKLQKNKFLIMGHFHEYIKHGNVYSLPKTYSTATIIDKNNNDFLIYI